MSAQTSLNEVDTAVYARLTGDATLVALLATPMIGTYAVFDFGAVPENQPFPYLTLGDSHEIGGEMKAFGTRRYLTMGEIHILDSQFGGFQESQPNLAPMKTLLAQKNQSNITLATQK